MRRSLSERATVAQNQLCAKQKSNAEALALLFSEERFKLNQVILTTNPKRQRGDEEKDEIGNVKRKMQPPHEANFIFQVSFFILSQSPSLSLRVRCLSQLLLCHQRFLHFHFQRLAARANCGDFTVAPYENREGN